MQHILEAASSGDWQALKHIFEGAITPDDDLLNEWWGKIWPQYEDEGYTKDEIRGYILSGNWDADHLRNDIAEHDAKFEGIQVAELEGSAAGTARVSAIKGIQASPDFASLASWFAHAFDYNGPAGNYPGLSDAAQNMDAIMALGIKLKALMAVSYDENANVDDRLEATRDFNNIVSNYNIQLDNGVFIYKDTITRVTGVPTAQLKNPIEATAYTDMKLAAYRDEAQNVCARAGVAPMAAIRRIKAANDEITRAMEELNTKASPIIFAYDQRRTAALEKNGYEGKKLEIVNLGKGYQMLRDNLAIEKPADYSYARDNFQTQAEYIQKYEAWSAKMQGLWDEQNDAVKAVRQEMQTLYEQAEKGSRGPQRRDGADNGRV